MLRAFAVASETSDVVGTVDLACTADGLLLHFVRVRPHSPGSAPTPPVRDQRAVVPYEAVRQAWDDGETLRLILDHPEIPYKKLVLAHVTRGGGWDQQQARRWRVRGQQVVVGCAALGLGGWVALMQALAPEWTPFLSVLGAVGVGYGSVQALHAVGRWTQLGGDNSAADRRGFFEELRTHLPPALLNDDAAVLPDARGLSATEPSTLVAASAAVMSSRISSRWIEENMSMLAAAGATFVLALVVLVTGSPVSPDTDTESTKATLDDDGARTGSLGSSQSSPLSLVAPMAELARETCVCQGPLSSVLPAKIPRVSLLPTIKHLRRHPRKPSLELEVAVVNNGSSPVEDLKGSVTFLRPGWREGDPLRIGKEQGLLYEGMLAPGAAIKWRVQGRGTSFRSQLSVEDSIDEGGLAPADAFAKLLSARTRSVRLHGAAMLTRLQDERAAGAIEKLRENAQESEAPFLDALARAAASAYACDLKMEETGGRAQASACVMNRGEESTSPVDVYVVRHRGPTPMPGALDEPPTPIATDVLVRRLRVPPRSGVVVRGLVAEPSDATDSNVVADVVLAPAH